MERYRVGEMIEYMVDTIDPVSRIKTTKFSIYGRVTSVTNNIPANMVFVAVIMFDQPSWSLRTHQDDSMMQCVKKAI